MAKRRKKRKSALNSVKLSQEEVDLISNKEKDQRTTWRGGTKILLPCKIEDLDPPIVKDDYFHIYRCSICKAESTFIISQEALNKFLHWHKKISPTCCPEKMEEEDVVNTTRETSSVESKSIQRTLKECNGSNEVLSRNDTPTKRKRGRPRKNPI